MPLEGRGSKRPWPILIDIMAYV